MTESLKKRIDAIDDDDSKPINNLRLDVLGTERVAEWNKVVDFLDADDYEEAGNGQTYVPPSIMIVSGPKGVGKSTIARQACHKKLREGKVYKAIIWFDKRRFLELMFSNPGILEESDPHAFQSVSELKQKLASDNDWVVLKPFLEHARQPRLEVELTSSEIVRQFFRDAQPYLLIIDDIDENFEEHTQSICTELERIRVPNKAILTSRIPLDKLPFSNRVHIPTLELGLLSREEADKVVVCECEEILPQTLWKGDNIDQTKQWLWEYSGGLPDIIIATIQNAKSKSKTMGTTTYWLGFFQEYARRYLEGDSKASTADIFAKLNAEEKYLLVALARATPLPPRSRVYLLAAIGVFKDHPEWDNYSEAITSLSAKRFLGYKIKWRSSDHRSAYDQEWQLLPFMRDLIATHLEEYTNGDYQQVRADLWLDFFSHYATSDKSRVDLLEYRDQGLTSLSWLVEREEWLKVIDFGKTIVNVLLNSQRENLAGKAPLRKTNIASQFIEACRQVIIAAEKSGNVNENAAHRLLLLKNVVFDEYPGIPREQLEGLLELRGQFDMLESGLKSSVAAFFADIAIMEGDVEAARGWLEKAEGTSAHEDVRRARLILADYLLHDGQLAAALNEVETVKAAGLGKKSEMNEVAIMAYQLIAKIMYLQGQLGDSRDAYQEAARQAKAANDLDLANDFLKAVTLIDWRLNSNPLDSIGMSIEALQPPSLTTIFECTACKHKITAREIWLKQTMACPNCPVIFHERCIVDLGLSQCPLCEAPLPTLIPA